jgi:hypothetical protein
MNLSSCYHRRRYLRVAASLVVALASLSGIARAAEFDERVKAPLMKDAGTLRAQVQSFSARFAALQAAGPEQLITNRTLAGERFDLAWQIQQAIDVQRPLGDLSELGFVSRGDGSYGIDLNAFPQWDRVDQKLPAILPQLNWGAFAQQLINRGMTAAETAQLRTYIDSHDAGAASSARTLPISLSFSKLVRKYDKINRPVPDATVLSYLYQRERAASEVKREWTAGLFGAVDPHGARILRSALSEGISSSIWAPSDQAEGIADILAVVRQPDFEQRATEQAKGATP